MFKSGALKLRKYDLPRLGFWKELREGARGRGEGLVVLAPMADVTDAAFRRLIARHGRPDAMWTEFVAADGLVHAPKEGRDKLMRDLIYTESERPIVAQFFTSRPKNMEKAAALAVELGFDAIDINMGCPDRSIEKQGAGAAMMKNPKLAIEVVRAAKRGADEASKRLGRTAVPPVSVKTRIGYSKNELSSWLPCILEAGPALVTIHCRTRKEMSLVPARWEHVAEAVAIRDKVQAHIPAADRTLIFGNGDVKSVEEAREKVRAAGADGAMLGRAIFGNPWLFRRNPDGPYGGAGVTRPERLRTMVEHTRLFTELLGDIKNFAIMKKHYKAYVNGWDGAKELRTKLMEQNNAQEVANVVEDYLNTAHLTEK